MAKKRSANAQSRIISRAGRDAAYRSRLKKAPHKVLAGMGIKVPSGARVKVLQNTSKLVHLVLPAKKTAKKAKKKSTAAMAQMGPAFTFF